MYKNLIINGSISIFWLVFFVFLVTAMIIKISNLSDGVHYYNFEESAKVLDLNEFFVGNVIADVELSKSRSQIVLNTKLSLKAKFECDRCNSESEENVVTHYKMVYFFGMEPVEDGSIGITYLPLDFDKINLENDVKDFSILAIPMKKLCSEDCKGLCIKCGKNLNEGLCNCSQIEVDNRWSPLIELKNKLNN